MSKTTVTIKFKSLNQLWNFAQIIQSSSLEIVTKDCMLICDCSEADLKLLNSFDAIIVDEVISFYLAEEKKAV